MVIIRRPFNQDKDHEFECRVTGATLLDWNDQIAIRCRVESRDGTCVKGEDYLCQILISVEEGAQCKIPVDMIDKTKYSPKILSDKFGLEISGTRYAKGMRISVIAEGFIETPKQINQYLFVHEVVNLQKLKVMANNDVKLLPFVNYSSCNKLVSQLELSF